MNTPADSSDEKQRILRARAETLAREPRSASADGAALEIVEFTLAHERYALESVFVTGAGPLDALTPLPCTPLFIRGLVNVRGRIFPVIDLKRFFELPDSGITDLHRILIVEAPGIVFGLLADTIGGVRRVPVAELQPPPATFTGIRADYLRGIAADRLVVLDGARILSDRRIVVHDEVET